jgi:curved DNA-binding protein CbpA
MDSVEITTAVTEPQIQLPAPKRVVAVTPEASRVCGLYADGEAFVLSRLVGSNLKRGDEVLRPEQTQNDRQPAEVLIRKPNVKRSDVYYARLGYAAQPKPNRRSEMFVPVEVSGGKLGIRAIHIPCRVIRDYFFAADRKRAWQYQQPLYRLLYLPADATIGELRIAYRLRRIELKQANASAADLATLERAYNLLADPQLRAAYDQLRIQPESPLAFPYSAFGSLIVEGEQGKDEDVFFAARILAFLPERNRRKVTFPLRKIDFFSDYAILRDRKRKLEVLIDQQLLPLKWDQTWSQWRHLINASIEISADFVRTGKYRKEDGQWRLIEWEAALPSRTEISLPPDLDESILNARRAHSRFGQYFDDIDRLRWHVQQIPTECDELRRRCWALGLPGDFDVIQITWRPDYDSYYYEQLSKGARTMYLFREEYIFELEKSVVVEVPQAGHATYVFAKPTKLHQFVWQYSKTSRQDILANRGNVAEQLGFVGRVVHGKNKAEWLREMRTRTGEPA